MKVLIELSPIEAKSAIMSGTLLALVEVIHAEQHKAENELKTASESHGNAQSSQVPQQVNQAPQNDPTYQPPQNQTPPLQAPVSQVPTAGQTYSMEQLAVAATQLVDAGRRQDLVNLLNSFGVQALTALPKEQYGAFATQLRGMGAKI